MRKEDLKKLEDNLKKPKDIKELPDKVYFSSEDSAKKWIDDNFCNYSDDYEIVFTCYCVKFKKKREGK